MPFRGRHSRFRLGRPLLSLGKLAHGQQQYYLDTVARGAEEYYTGGKEAPGEWYGIAALRLGLHGAVDAEDLGAVLGHLDPHTGVPLTDDRSHPQVAGFDATFSAPKSVSLLFALGSPEVSNEVRNAHDAAVRGAFEALEDVAAVGRRGHAGAITVSGDGFVAAGFRHRTSRAAEPQLHTHVVIANLVRSPADGRWTALDARPLYRWARAVGHLYEAQLRWELTRRLGVEWGPARNGIADIDGVTKPVINAFSTRRRQIAEHLEAHGESSARAAQVAAYATRSAKDAAQSPETMIDRWRVTAAEHGFTDERFVSLLGRNPTIEIPAPGDDNADALFRRLAAPDGLTARRATFGRGEILEAICNQLPHGAPVNTVVALADAFVGSPHVIALSREQDTVTRWTTPEMLATEHRLLELVDAGRDRAAGTARSHAVDAALRMWPSFTAEQAAMVRQICLTGDGVDVIEGVAGAGKTTALAAANQAWTNSDYRVRGVCLAARAAKNLQEGSRIPSMTLDRMLRQLDHAPLTSRDVVVVDEAGMVGTRRLLALVDHAEQAHAKVVLVGDPRQLPEIDAGGAFRGLLERHADSGLFDNRRQHSAWERDALAELRHGNPNHAFDSYLAHDRVHVGGYLDVRSELIADWSEARAAGQQVLIVAPNLRAVDDLNQLARDCLQLTGEIGRDRAWIGFRPYAEGDRVLALRNDYQVGILNGTLGTITSIDDTNNTINVRTDDQRTVTVPFDYAERNLTYGYATTIHKAQGTTVDRCFVYLDEGTSREHAYTALSRGRDRNDLYINTHDSRADDRHGPELDPDTKERLRTSLNRTISQLLATDQTRQRSRDTGLGLGR